MTCLSSFRPFLVFLALLAVWPAYAAFTDNNDGTVTDSVTGLMWDKCSWGQSNNTDCSGGAATTPTWTEALGVAVTANAMNSGAGYKGYNDWRLPNVNELESLVKIDAATSPVIDITVFPNTISTLYWTASTIPPLLAFAWVVYFDSGIINTGGKTGTSHVRLVRSGQSFASFDLMVDLAAPAFASATANGSTLVMTYTEANTLDAANIPAASAFTVKVNAVAQASPANVVVSAAGKTVTLTLAAAVVNGDVVTVSYTDPTAGDDANAIQDAAGNDAAMIADQAVTNNTADVTAPVFASATANGSTLVMTYTEANTLHATNNPVASAFTVKVNAVAQASPTNVVVSAAGKTVTLTLAAAVVNGDVVAVSYKDPAAANDAYAIQDAAGNDAATITDQAVTNNTPDVTAPTLSSVGVSGTTLTGTTLAASSDEAATGYWIVVARAATAPSAAQVKAAATYSGVSIVASGNNATMGANIAKTFNVAGLAAGTDYDLYFVAEDGSGNLVASPTKVQFYTLDTVPNAFSFTAVTGAAVSSASESAAITVAGINAAATISISGGKYAVSTDNGATWGAYTVLAGTVNLNDRVKIKLTAAPAYNTAVTATLTIGGVAGTFSTTTQTAPDPDPAPPPTIPTPIPNPTPAAPTEVRVDAPGQTVTAVVGLPLRIAAGANVEGTMIVFPQSVQNQPINLIIGDTHYIVTALTNETQLTLRTYVVDGQTVVALTLTAGRLRIRANNPGDVALVLSDWASRLLAGTADMEMDVERVGDTLDLILRQGYIVLPGLTRRSASAEFSGYRIYAGERVALDAVGQVATHVLGNKAGDGAGDPLTLSLPANLSLAVGVPQLDAVAARLGKTLEQALADVAGVTLVYGQTTGVLALELDGQRVYALPLGTVSVDPTRADGVRIEANGLATVSMSGIAVTLVPSVAYLNRLAEDLEAALPGATLKLGADGVIVATLATGERYALRPDWFSQIDVTQPAGFAATADGRLGYVKSFRAFVLHPAFADFAALTAAVEEVLPGATLQTHPDGTVTVVSGEQHWTLTPQMQLNAAPEETRQWWAEADGTLRLRNADGTLQGFRAE